jgi:hypothetical protein
LDLAAMSKGLHRGRVQQVGPTIGFTRNHAILKQEQMFDPALESGACNLLDIRGGVARSDLLVEPPQGLKRRPNGYRPNQFQRLPIHLVLAEAVRQSVDSRLNARRICGQTMKQRHFMFDADHNERRMAIFQESVHVAIHLTIKVAKVVFSVIAIVHRLGAKRSLGRTRNEAGGFRACVFRKSRWLTEFIRAFENARVIQL